MINIIIIALLFIDINEIIIHFGRNPDRGGRPPSDISSKARVGAIIIDLENIEFRSIAVLML